MRSILSTCEPFSGLFSGILIKNFIYCSFIIDIPPNYYWYRPSHVILGNDMHDSVYSQYSFKIYQNCFSKQPKNTIKERVWPDAHATQYYKNNLQLKRSCVRMCDEMHIWAEALRMQIRIHQFQLCACGWHRNAVQSIRNAISTVILGRAFVAKFMHSTDKRQSSAAASPHKDSAFPFKIVHNTIDGTIAMKCESSGKEKKEEWTSGVFVARGTSTCRRSTSSASSSSSLEQWAEAAVVRVSNAVRLRSCEFVHCEQKTINERVTWVACANRNDDEATIATVHMWVCGVRQVRRGENAIAKCRSPSIHSQ